MARSRWTDLLQSHLFWALDISSGAVPVFTPLFGFSAISAPRITAEVESFKDQTNIFQRNVITSGQVGEITFSRAASMYDSDFYNWIYYAIFGTNAAKQQISLTGVLGDSVGPIRRTLMVIHFSRINLSATSNGIVNAVAAAAEGALFSSLSGSTGTSAGVAAGVGAVVGAGASLAGGNIGFSLGPTQFATWLPARAWILHDCIPTSYSAASDFDAHSSDISLAHLTVMPEWIEEWSSTGGTSI